MKGGTGMYNLTIILLSTINSELINSNNYRIAKYILENMRALEDISITELAKECYVSNSSISRFCRDIGLRDYNELKSQLQSTSQLTSMPKINSIIKVIKKRFLVNPLLKGL